MTKATNLRALAPGFLSGALFFLVVLAGCGYIVSSKLNNVTAIYVTTVPVAFMIIYALVLGLGRLFRLRDDQSGDNLYYMGFLFTLTSLGVSLYQYSSLGSAEQIVQNFGIAIASTIAGISLRIFFNQMRRDPIEVENVARLELAEASRKVKRELEETVLEFAYFRRATQQSITDSLEEIKALLSETKANFVGQLGEFAKDSSGPLNEQSRLIADSSAATVQALDAVVSKLKSMQTPDHIIEIKLNPAIQGLSRAVNNFTKSSDEHMQAIADSIKETQKLTEAATKLVEQARAEAIRLTSIPPTYTEPHSVEEMPTPEGEARQQPTAGTIFRGFFTR